MQNKRIRVHSELVHTISWPHLVFSAFGYEARSALTADTVEIGE